VIRELIARQVIDLLVETERRLGQFRIATVEDVRSQPESVVEFSQQLRDLKTELERFLNQRVYRHPRVAAMAEDGRRIIRALFDEMVRRPELLPPSHLRRWEGSSEHALHVAQGPAPFARACEKSLERVVADYLAGMTDRYIRQEYLRLFQTDSDC
jgi:dGTPase